MNIHKTQLTNCIKAIIITSLGMASNVQAQNVVSASVVSNSFNTPCGTPLLSNTNITSLNVDMMEVDANTSNTRCAWGTGSDTYIWGAGYSGLNQGGSCTNVAGITVGHTTLGQTTVPLPAPWSGIANNTINYIDVAVGKHYNHRWSHDEYFVIAVYESGGNIYLEHYYIDIATSFSMMASYISLACPPTICWLSNNPLQITSNNSSRRPHIDLIYDKTYPTTGLSHDAIGYVITWQEGSDANAEIWGADGPLSDITAVGYTPRPPFNPPFLIDDGQMPDVAGVNAAQSPIGTDPDKAYVAYLNRNGDEVHLSEWDFNSGPSYTITNHGAISATTTNPGEFHYPRISGPQYYDYPPSSVTNDPICVVAVTENDGGSNYKINTYARYVTGSPLTVPVVNASNYNSFGFGSYNAMKPSITGVGSIVSSLYAGATAAYTDYPTVFYADYDNNNTTWTTSGDIYAMGTEVMQTATPAVNLQGNNYSEVNGSELEISAYHSLAPGNEPHVAIATTNNSGYNMISAWFGGDLLYFALNNGAMPYQFKPARPSAISNTGDKNFAVYPNPVTDELNVTNAAGSEYIILDITGRKLSSGIINEADAAINVSQYANGIYMLELSKGNKTEKLKFVKQ